ncbi:hypothetical protein OG787_10185 [Streptomyces sp. NBC_00075]|uniref:Uncharacterized protein n=1 Tax=Streptomyces sp. NBC_00093 TaxID=2975649 RepID=A0AAU1ZVR4_9ACTN
MIDSAKWHAKLVMVAIQKKSDQIGLGSMPRSELTLIASQGYPTAVAPTLAQASLDDRVEAVSSGRELHGAVGVVVRRAGYQPGTADAVQERRVAEIVVRVERLDVGVRGQRTELDTM